MTTPTFTNFSRSKGTVSATVQRIESYVCQPWNCRLDGFALLQTSDDPYEGGYEMIGDLPTPCRDYANVAHLLEGVQPFGLVYFVRDFTSFFYVHFTEIDGAGHTVTVDMETTMVYRRDDDHPQNGEWIQAWLISLAIAVDADVCAYGNRGIADPDPPGESVEEWLRRRRPAMEAYLKRPLYEALDPQVVLTDLREGRLLEYPRPVLHALRYDLISPFEIRCLMKDRPKADRIIYKLAPGYHVLSNIVYP